MDEQQTPMPRDAKERLEHGLSTLPRSRVMHELKTGAWPFNHLLTIALCGPSKLGRKGAWILSSLLQDTFKDRWSIPVAKVLDSLPNKPDEHHRELLKVLARTDIPTSEEGRIWNICTSIWKRSSHQSSLRYCALTLLTQIVDKYPELGEKLAPLLDEQYLISLSPGIRKSVLTIYRTRFCQKGKPNAIL